MTFTFRPAIREQTNVLVGIAGPSSSGKTYSALRLATGLADGRPIFMIDTEAKRGLHYADAFRFQHGEFKAPFRPQRYLEAIAAAKGAGAAVVIVDSMSHEHEGPGGILEWHEEELSRMAGQDYGKREKVKFAAWIKPKAAHNQFVNGVLQIGVHCIFCFRAKEKLALVRTNGKVEPVPQGWQPICSDRFEYEMTTLLMLPPNSHGMPDLNAAPTKLQEQHRSIFPAGRQIDEEMGRRLAEWASGGAPAQSNGRDAFEKAREMANHGTVAFRTWWNSEGKQYRASLRDRLDELRQIAEEADAGDDDDPFRRPVGRPRGARNKPKQEPASDTASQNESPVEATSDPTPPAESREERSSQADPKNGDGTTATPVQVVTMSGEVLTFDLPDALPELASEIRHNVSQCPASGLEAYCDRIAGALAAIREHDQAVADEIDGFIADCAAPMPDIPPGMDRRGDAGNLV